MSRSATTGGAKSGLKRVQKPGMWDRTSRHFRQTDTTRHSGSRKSRSDDHSYGPAPGGTTVGSSSSPQAEAGDGLGACEDTSHRLGRRTSNGRSLTVVLRFCASLKAVVDSCRVLLALGDKRQLRTEPSLCVLVQWINTVLPSSHIVVTRRTSCREHCLQKHTSQWTMYVVSRREAMP